MTVPLTDLRLVVDQVEGRPRGLQDRSARSIHPAKRSSWTHGGWTVTPRRETQWVAFSNQSERLTMHSLHRALAPLGYTVSQKVRTLDYVEAAAANPQATALAGPSLLDQLLPKLRAAAGPFGPNHPWLQPGDWHFAMDSHLDFVVHAPFGERWATHPLFAVEFDGPQHRTDPAVIIRACAKNRLCLASGLPLLRLDDTFLRARDHLTLVRWVAELWAAYRAEMPGLIARRDADLESMTPAERDEALDVFIAPELDVEFLFRLDHQYPPTATLADRLAGRYGFSFQYMRAVPKGEVRYRVSRWRPVLMSLEGGLTQTWTGGLTLERPDGERVELTSVFDVKVGYPLHPGSDGKEDLYAAFGEGRFPVLPPGPFTSVTNILGEELCMYNLRAVTRPAEAAQRAPGALVGAGVRTPTMAPVEKLVASWVDELTDPEAQWRSEGL